MTEHIINKLKNNSIKFGQLDPNGLCNLKCWYCPVSDFGNPKEFINTLTLSQIEHILIELRMSEYISEKFNSIFPFHYNEILLYKNYEGMLDLFRRYGFNSSLATNGTTLTKEKTDIYLRNKDIMGQIVCNCPSIIESDWISKTGMTSRLFKTLMNNFEYFHDNCDPGDIVINLNCSTENTYSSEIENKGIKTNKEHMLEIEFLISEKFPKFVTSINDELVDRAGLLSDKYKLTNKKENLTIVNNCNYMGNSRIFDWFHINSRGDLFLCCNDFHMNYTFGNIFEKSFDEIWISEEHASVINRAFNNICTKCVGGEFLINEEI